MSERNEHSPLGGLPRPRSPQQLDDKILAHARRQAPQRNAPWRPGWVTGMATVSIVAIALLIVPPQYLLPISRDYSEIPVQRDSTSRKAPVIETKRFDFYSSLEMPKKETRAIAQHPQLTEESMPMPEAVSSSPMPERFEEPQADAEAHAFAKITASAYMRLEPLHLDPEQLALRLAKCADMLEQGDEEQADRAYQMLRQECPACDLPDTLEQALADLEETAAP
jgi:hypothetical protein